MNQPWPAYVALQSVLADVDAHIERMPGDAAGHVLRARMLRDLGRPGEAAGSYHAALAIDATHVDAMLGLASLDLRAGKRVDAIAILEKAIAVAPTHIGALTMLAGVLGIEHAERALELLHDARARAPEAPAVNELLCTLYAQLGDREQARNYRTLAFAQGALVTQPYRGSTWPIPALVLVSTDGGNLNHERLLPDTRFAVTKLMVEAFDESTPLPAHRFIVNAIADADIHAETLAKAGRIINQSSAPVINQPDIVAITSRGNMASLLSGIPSLRVPSVARFDAARPPEPPFLLRAAGFHMGRFFERVQTPSELAPALATMPAGNLLAIDYIDTSADGAFRKYRMMSIGGTLYPLHLAISRNWKVHYFSSAMSQSQAFRDEERAFVKEPRTVLGPAAMRALESITERIKLEYFGIDFALDAAGNVVLFEANAAMSIIAPGDDPMFAYRRESAQRAIEAAAALAK